MLGGLAFCRMDHGKGTIPASRALTENGTRTNELTNQKESLGAALQHSTPPVQEASEPTPINWHRGMFRGWLLVSAGWIMG